MSQAPVLATRDYVCSAFDCAFAMALNELADVRSVVYAEDARGAEAVNGHKASVTLLLDMLAEIGGHVGVIEPLELDRLRRHLWNRIRFGTASAHGEDNCEASCAKHLMRPGLEMRKAG
jgi:hypothetical protein